MADNNRGKWIDCHEVGDPPENRDKQSASNHDSSTEDAENESTLEAL